MSDPGGDLMASLDAQLKPYRGSSRRSLSCRRKA